MKNQKLNIRYHNPNSESVTADYILKILIESSKVKFEEILQKEAENNHHNKQESPA